MCHQNIVSCLQCYCGQEEFIIIYDYCPYGDITNIINIWRSNGEAIPESIILSIMTQIVIGLKFAHSRGMVHQDLRPNNIFMFKGGKTKIGNFRINKKEIKDDLLYYLPPEKFISN